MRVITDNRNQVDTVAVQQVQSATTSAIGSVTGDVAYSDRPAALAAGHAASHALGSAVGQSAGRAAGLTAARSTRGRRIRGLAATLMLLLPALGLGAPATQTARPTIPIPRPECLVCSDGPEI